MQHPDELDPKNDEGSAADDCDDGTRVSDDSEDGPLGPPVRDEQSG